MYTANLLNANPTHTKKALRESKRDSHCHEFLHELSNWEEK